MHAKYQVSICNGSKVMANVKVVLKQTGQKQYDPQILLGGHKNAQTVIFFSQNLAFSILNIAVNPFCV